MSIELIASIEPIKTGESMKVTEIEAKTIISRTSKPSSWFGVQYNMNIYRGCQHHCIYCDSRSECYHVDDFDGEIIVKTNAATLLDQSLRRMRKRYTIGTGAMSDPYMPIEKKYELTRESLKVIDRYGMRVNLATKSNLVLRDLDVLGEIAKRYACVSMTITTMDDDLARIIEPSAPLPSKRMEAVGILNSLGIQTGLLVMPQLPYIMEDRDHLEAIIKACKDYDVQFVYPGFAVTLRDRQREYFYEKLAEYDPELVDKYKRRFKNSYGAYCVNGKKMHAYFKQRCKEEGIYVGMPMYEKKVTETQLSLFKDD